MKATTYATTVGVFSSRSSAQEAVNELKSMGFKDDQIGLIAKDESTGKATKKSHSTTSKWEEGTGVGAAAGAATGTGLGLAVAAGLLTPVGPIIAGGALIALLASAGVGATVGTIVGGLVGLGVPEDDAAYYETEVHAGRYVVTVNAAKRTEEVKELFNRYGAYDRSTAEMPRVADDTMDTDQTVKLHEQKLKPHKETVKTGSVGVRKEVHTEHKTITVPVEREEIVIERHAVNKSGRAGDIKGEEIRIPTKEERVTVGKETVVKEEVKVGKRKTTKNETIGDDVRSEELVVETNGKAKVREKHVAK